MSVLLLIILACTSLAESKVEFAASTLYDIYDFTSSYRARLTVNIDRCNDGCYIYAATTGDVFGPNHDEQDPYAKNLVIYDADLNINSSNIATLAQANDGRKAKEPMMVSSGFGTRHISVINYNNVNDKSYSSVVLYAIDIVTANRISYDVFDPYYSSSVVLDPEREISTATVTFLSAIPFTLTARPRNEWNSITARLVGFDHTLSHNRDDCPWVYKTPDDAVFFPGFSLMANPPILTLEIKNIEATILETSLNFATARDLSVAGYIASPGWNGCHDISTQSFRTPSDRPTDTYILSSEKSWSVDLVVIPHFDNDDHRLTITQLSDVEATEEVDGSSPGTITYYSTHELIIIFGNMSGNQGFLLTYSASSPSSPPTVTTRKPTTTISRTTPRATSGPAPSTADRYCKCGFKDGWFDEWDAAEIWVDLIVILDTSASMGDSLEEAKSLLTSFIGLMSTDTARPFYSRIGVIAASDKIEVVYNLNMSSADSLDWIQQHPVDKIDVGAAFQAALQMFADGEKRASYRENARQIVYYLTNSAPGANLNGVNDFKTSGGIVIVNDFVLEGDIANSALMKLASDNFFFTDLSENYLDNLGVLCEANCYCAPTKHAFNDDDISERTEANRGCFHPVNSGIPQQKARETCQRETASLVSIHDEQKEFFVSTVVSIFGPKKKYWLGLQKDGASWNWDDKSTDPFTDWDVNQPDTHGGSFQCAYATQTTGLNVRWTAANCAMGGVIYVCESAPCSAGNTDC